MRRIISVIVLSVILIASAGVFYCFAEEAAHILQLSEDVRLKGPLESCQKAEYHVEKGEKAFRSRPGYAQKQFEHAEDYLLKAEFFYKELGQEHGIDTSNEMAICRKRYRQIHVMTNKARRKAKIR